jgi:hypothetical protein
MLSLVAGLFFTKSILIVKNNEAPEIPTRAKKVDEWNHLCLRSSADRRRIYAYILLLSVSISNYCALSDALN